MKKSLKSLVLLVLALIFMAPVASYAQSYHTNSKKAIKYYKTAKKMYDKFAIFSETFAALGNQLTTVSGTYQKGITQLCEGKGNFVRQLESLKEKGVITDKTVSPKLLPSDEEE